MEKIKNGILFGDFMDHPNLDSISLCNSNCDILKLRVEHDDYGGAYVRATAVLEMLQCITDILNSKNKNDDIKFWIVDDFSRN